MSADRAETSAIVGVAAAERDFEIGTISDTNNFIATELLPFAQRLFGAEKIARDHEAGIAFNFLEGDDRAIHVELAVTQLGGLGVRGLQYDFDVTQRQRLNKLSAAQWSVIRRTVDLALKQQGADPLPKRKKISSYKRVDEFHAVSYKLRHGSPVETELWGGYELQIDDTNVRGVAVYHIQPGVPIPTNDKNEEETLSILDGQVHRRLAPADVDMLYRVLDKFGHVPDDKRRAKQALAEPQLLKQSALPMFYDFG